MTTDDNVSDTSITYRNPEIKHSNPGTEVYLKFGFGPMPPSIRNSKIFYFDIDNCLYERTTGIHEMMQVKIHDYFKHNLKLNDEEAHELHMNYYKTYGLAIEGLVRVHKVDAIEYNAQVDDSLNLPSVLGYNEKLRDMLVRIRRDFDYFWLVTNAYSNHALRVISLLGIGDLFDGLTFCDYSKFPIICKPMYPYFQNFLNLTNIDISNKEAMSKQYFVDDSELNVKAAFKLGFGNVIHYVEINEEFEKLKSSEDFKDFYESGDNSGKKIKIIRNILDLERVL
ncbi:uncharacterized protein PRCAT00000313001 [Priceomyces carsonii]|uniref:uncharacterized protein n=1 Tax=Priceomyces carsonii TaxID=28549 RepID=UPI002ED9CE65|nr:unnamed protein product [Priceomyces carsonii]